MIYSSFLALPLYNHDGFDRKVDALYHVSIYRLSFRALLLMVSRLAELPDQERLYP